jgi:signal transduction histidine kinase
MLRRATIATVALASNRAVSVTRLAAASVVVAAGIGALVVAEGPAKATSYAGSSILAAVLIIAAGFALVGAGLAISFTRPEQHVGDLAILAGFVWFAPVWIGWQGGSPLVRSLGMVAAGFTFPLLVHVVLAHPSGRIGSKPARALVAGAYIEAGIAAFGLALVRDPYFDPGCWSNCTVNRFLLRSLPSLARAIQTADRWFVAVAAVGLAAICAWRLITESGQARRALSPVAGPAILFAGTVAAHPIALHWISPEDPASVVFASIFFAGSATVVLLAGGLALAAFRMRIQRRAVARTVASLGEAPAPGSLQSALAAALGDPALRIAYWLPGSERYVDASGKTVDEPAAAPGRAVTTLVRDDRPIAVVSHSAALAELEREIGPAVRLGLENERLQAETLAHMEELRASRTRIVETGDAERRRLERNLHDGAQQRLLALSYDIRLARSAAETGGDTHAETVLAEAVSQAQSALQELRQLAHGIFPAILAEAGLEPALETLADAAPLPVEIKESAEGRYPPPVEMAVYVLVAEALQDAAGRSATRAVVNTVREDSRLLVTVDDDGSPRTSPMVLVADRVGAVGGTLDVEPTRLQAVIPCE